ncbi:MAG: hypothetical protein ACYTEQ_29840 [Planctomycetota bacterium]|jgi:hypothetical protein
MKIQTGMIITTEDHRITVSKLFRDEHTGAQMVGYYKEERGDIGRYIYHEPQAMVACVENFARLYWCQRITESDNKATTRRCSRCEEDFEDSRPYAKICPKCRLPSGPKDGQIFWNEQRNGKSRLFKTEG